MSEREFSWNDTIQNDSTFEVLPKGDYDFTVKSFERGRHNGSDGLPPCNKAVLTLEVTNGQKRGTFTQNLFLHSSQEWKLCAFFVAIGARRHGQAIQMDWNKVQGARGRCKVGVRKWTGNDGQERESNQVERFYDPSKADPAPAPTAFQAGKF